MQKLMEYHDFYLQTDVLLFCDVFENFRATYMQHYKLDPAHYFPAPGLAWNAMLKMTGVELELMVEREFHDIIDKGTREALVVSAGCWRRQATNTWKITMQASIRTP